MNCNNFETQILDFLNKKLNTEQEAAFTAHANNCAYCAKELAGTKQMLELINRQPEIKPSPNLKHNFNQMLTAEIEMQSKFKNSTGNRILGLNRTVLSAVAAAAILLIGIFLGRVSVTFPLNNQSSDLNLLQNEVKEMKEVLLYSMLNNESASERIKAVNYAEQIPNPDSKVIDALFNTLNTDKNANVRLAAAYSLSRFTFMIQVRDSLVTALGKQTEPIVQITLINLLVEMNEVKALDEIKRLANDPNALIEVKEQAKKGISKLI